MQLIYELNINVLEGTYFSGKLHANNIILSQHLIIITLLYTEYTVSTSWLLMLLNWIYNDFNLGVLFLACF